MTDPAPTPDESAHDDLAGLLYRDRYPRSNGYDPTFVINAFAGPHPLWLAESVCELLDLKPGMRVLDVGCGYGATSVFLAREYGVRVTAVDRYTPINQLWDRIRDSGVEDRVVPIKGDARSLPFPDEYFDAAVSLDSYMYFGTDASFLAGFHKLLRPGAPLGLVMPGLVDEIDETPRDLIPEWAWMFPLMHSPAWWRTHIARSGVLQVDLAEVIPDGWRDWADWNNIVSSQSPIAKRTVASETKALETDQGRRWAQVRIVARRPEPT